MCVWWCRLAGRCSGNARHGANHRRVQDSGRFAAANLVGGKRPHSAYSTQSVLCVLQLPTGYHGRTTERPPLDDEELETARGRRWPRRATHSPRRDWRWRGWILKVGRDDAGSERGRQGQRNGTARGRRPATRWSSPLLSAVASSHPARWFRFWFWSWFHPILLRVVF